MKEKDNNPLLCDPETGICELPLNEEPIGGTILKSEKSVKIIYFSDPICSACWGVEPTLRKLKLIYGNSVEFEYYMGGLLPSWQAMGNRVNPASLAAHSDEMSKRFEMPMNGEVWIKDPPDSSYPPSIAFKAAQIQDEEKAVVFLRNIREDLYVRGKNIAKYNNIEQAAKEAGLDLEKLKADYNEAAVKLFEEDLKLAREMGVRGFPCFYITNTSGNSEMIYGMKPFEDFENALLKINKNLVAEEFAKGWKELFTKYNSMTTREFGELSGISFEKANIELKKLTDQKELNELKTKSGSLWTKN